MTTDTTAPPRKSATELYSITLKKQRIEIGEQIFIFKPGLTDTVQTALRTDDDVMVSCAGVLGAVSKNVEKAKRLVQAFLQVEWYLAKGVTREQVPLKVIATYDEALAAAKIVDPATEPAPEKTKKAKREKGAIRRGVRPFIKALIERDGITDETVLLERARAEFPEKDVKMKLVRGRLRRTGHLPWTARKGKGRKEKSATAETTA